MRLCQCSVLPEHVVTKLWLWAHSIQFKQTLRDTCAASGDEMQGAPASAPLWFVNKKQPATAQRLRHALTPLHCIIKPPGSNGCHQLKQFPWQLQDAAWQVHCVLHQCHGVASGS
jgi:hypothetical protein